METFHKAKESLPKIIAIKKDVIEFLKRNSFIDRVEFEISDYFNDYLTVHYFAGLTCKWNDGWKYKKEKFDSKLFIDSINLSKLSTKNSGNVTFNLSIK